MVDFQNLLHQIVSVPDDYHDRMICNDLQTGERSLLWQYDPQRVSKYMPFRERNTVMYYEDPATQGVRAHIEIMTSKSYVVRINWDSRPKVVPINETVYSRIRPIHLTEDELIKKGFLCRRFWTDGYVNLYLTDSGLEVQLEQDKSRFLKIGEDNHLNVIRTVHELENVYQQNRVLTLGMLI